jgi:Helix-turn-helix domain
VRVWVVAAMTEFNKIGYLKCARGMNLQAAGFVLAVLYSYSDPDGGNIRPGIKRLAADCCMDESSIRRHLKVLADRGLIRQESRGGRSGDGRTRASTYRLCVPGSTGHGCPVENVSTGHDCPVDNGSQPLNSGSQPLNSGVSTAQQCPPTQVLPSNKPPSSRAPSTRDAADRLMGLVKSAHRRTQTGRDTIAGAITEALVSGVDEDHILDIIQSVDRKSKWTLLVSRLKAAVWTKDGRTA